MFYHIPKLNIGVSFLKRTGVIGVSPSLFLSVPADTRGRANVDSPPKKNVNKTQTGVAPFLRDKITFSRS
jgi:hypothetical protein